MAGRSGGNRGGFNPFRDKNGEYTTSSGHGKLGRSRWKGGTEAVDRFAGLGVVAARADQRTQDRINALPTARQRSNARRARSVWTSAD